MRFEGTSAYVATDDLKVAVNAAITLERPLLVKGEPGTGKTVLALEIAKSLNAPLAAIPMQSVQAPRQIKSLYISDRYEYSAGRMPGRIRRLPAKITGQGTGKRPAGRTVKRVLCRPLVETSARRRSCSSAIPSASARPRTHGRDGRRSGGNAPRFAP